METVGGEGCTEDVLAVAYRRRCGQAGMQGSSIPQIPKKTGKRVGR